MDYKLFLKTFFIAFLIFATVVVLGMKYNWVRFLQTDSSQTSEESMAGLPEPVDKKPQSSDQKNSAPNTDRNIGKNIGQNTDQYVLVDEGSAENNQNDQIRNDCIRASRRAGVTDENILAVVAQCVEMSTKSENNTLGGEAIPIETENEDNIRRPQSPPEDGLELTRKACRIVADEEQGVTKTEREQIVEQCIKANMGSNN